jgi:methyl-accepting chemotaxis protein
MSIRFKLTLLVVLVLLLLTSVIGTYSVLAMRDRLIESAQIKLKSDLNMARNLIDSTYPGPWNIQGDKLYKGNVPMNENYQLVDSIGQMTGDTVTVFMGDIRITTNVKTAEGKRAVGTRSVAEVTQAVLKEGQTFLGKAQVVGNWNQTAYEPIKDQQGSIIGMLYTGVPNNIYDETVRVFAEKIILAGAVVLVASIIFCFFIMRQIFAKPFAGFLSFSQNIASGDLTKEIDYRSGDELGRLAHSFNTMAGSLKDLSRQIQQASDHISDTSAVLTAQAEQTAGAADENARTANSISSAVDIMAGNIKEVSGQAEEANRQANEGQERIKEFFSTMEEIDKSVVMVAGSLHSLDQVINKISLFVDTINDLSEQINLLALNAAIESARAGEAGRGFAVVAEEVRKLAESSAKSAKEIGEVITDVQRQSATSVRDMEESRKTVSHGIDMLQAMSRSLVAIVEVVESLNQRPRDISEASGQVAGSVQNLAATTEEQTAAMEEVTASASALKKITESMNAMVTRFKV